MKEIKIIDVGNKYGNMNLNPKFYPNYFNNESIRESFDLRREVMGFEYGFNGYTIYMADQIKKDGSFFEITEDYVEAYPKGWSSIKEDILVMTGSVKEVAIGHPVADCPVVIGYDMRQKIVAVGHCSAEFTDKMLPVSIIDSLFYSYGSRDNDILVYISSGVEKDSYLYDKYPKWANNDKIWNKMIKEDKNGIFHIDLKGAIKKQLIQRNIKESNIKVSKIDTVTNQNYYSNRAEYLGYKEKAGRNFPCVFFKKEKVRIRQK